MELGGGYDNCSPDIHHGELKMDQNAKYSQIFSELEYKKVDGHIMNWQTVLTG